MGSEPIHDVPSDTTAEQGCVIVDGPGGVAITLTPDAAQKTGERLQASAGHAREHKTAHASA